MFDEEFESRELTTSEPGDNDEVSGGDGADIVEETILAMENTKVCFHPRHCHSFQQVHFMFSLQQKCAGCNERLNFSLFNTGGGSGSSVVKCAACGAMAHRSCALSDQSIEWKGQICPVNSAELNILTVPSEEDGDCDVDDDNDNDNDGLEKQGSSPLARTPPRPPPSCFQKLQGSGLESSAQEMSLPGSPWHRLQKDDLPDQKRPQQMEKEHSLSPWRRLQEEELSERRRQQLEDKEESNWSRVSWVKNAIPTISFPDSSSPARTKSSAPPPPPPSSSGPINEQETLSTAVIGDRSKKEEDEEVHVTPLHYANHPFASVSRALQENILIHFQQLESELVPIEEEEQQVRKIKASNSSLDTHNEDVSAGIDSSAEQSRNNEEGRSTPNPLGSLIESVKASVSNRPAMGAVAMAAGGLAGGLAGAMVAGPAGAYAGSQLGTAGALGVILEGSVSIGVFVASIATGSNIAKQVQDQIEEHQRRVLTMGEEGTTRKVLLVRPEIRIDPVWEQIFEQAVRSAPSKSLTTFIPVVDTANRQRYRRDSDIVKAEEDEIPTNDKILLLVSRMLCDKSSVPGFVYRYLVDAFLDRLDERQERLETTQSIAAVSPRARRDDTHAVIKYVTATLLEARPGFGATPTSTELTATAVEGLVFGRLYDVVFEEIIAESTERDEKLSTKIRAFRGNNSRDRAMEPISQEALEALSHIPKAHSVGDKLFYCVQFLERISNLFTSLDDGPGGEGPCADSLLKLSCQHLVASDLPAMNAEITFLEEFARDEELLRGREGYSLVTLQASLHFLNMSKNIETEIFGQDDEEENVPVVEEEELSLSDDDLDE